MSQVTKYLASIGKKGGEAGTGKAKKRSRKQYQEMARKSAEARQAKKEQSGPHWYADHIDASRRGYRDK